MHIVDCKVHPPTALEVPLPPPSALDSNSYQDICYTHMEARAEIPNSQWVNMQNVIGI